MNPNVDLSYLHILDPVKGSLGRAVILLITAIYYNVIQFGDQDLYPKDYSSELLKSKDPVFDFVIVGSGTAGCVLANRLTEIADFKVLLIEHGGYPSPTSDVPFLYFSLENSDEDWKFKMNKQEFACKGFVQEQCIISNGKVLGGSTTINNMHYHRGTTQDYDSWGLNEWKSTEVNKYFVNLERYTGKTAVPFRVGTKGNITLGYFKSDHFLRLPLSKMYKTAGYKPLQKDKYLGYRDVLATVSKSVRVNMAKAFLAPIRQRGNFRLAIGASGHKIRFSNPTDRRMKAIEVMIGKHKKLVRVRKELILAGGPINNVKLLQFSGVGPRDTLAQFRIPLVAELPVGKNFQAHFRVPIFVAIDKCCGQCLNCSTVDCQNDLFDFADFYQQMWDYVMDKIGMFTNTGINDFVAYISTNHRRRDYPNVAVFHHYFKRNDFYLAQFLDNRMYHPDVAKSILKYNKLRNMVMFAPTLLNPKSRGDVYLNNTLIHGNPAVRANFLTDDESTDFKAIYAAVTMIVALTDSIAMQRYKARFLDIDIPACRNFRFCSEYYFRCVIVNLGGPTRTSGGTARMGRACDNRSVVDADFNVLKVRGVRVADRSVAPHVGTTNMVATEALFAEKLSDALKSKWHRGYVSPYRTKERAINVV